jgi:type IV pilus assembly protein PilV
VTERALIRAGGKADGFTLVELMIVLVIIAIGILALAQVQMSSSRDVDITGRFSSALAIAQDRLEQARALGYAAAVSDSGQQGVYNWTTAVDSTAPDLRSAVVTVSWQEPSGTRNVQLQTFLSSR